MTCQYENNPAVCFEVRRSSMKHSSGSPLAWEYNRCTNCPQGILNAIKAFVPEPEKVTPMREYCNRGHKGQGKIKKSGQWYCMRCDREDKRKKRRSA